MNFNYSKNNFIFALNFFLSLKATPSILYHTHLFNVQYTYIEYVCNKPYGMQQVNFGVRVWSRTVCGSKLQIGNRISLQSHVKRLYIAWMFDFIFVASTTPKGNEVMFKHSGHVSKANEARLNFMGGMPDIFCIDTEFRN